MGSGGRNRIAGDTGWLTGALSWSSPLARMWFGEGAVVLFWIVVLVLLKPMRFVLAWLVQAFHLTGPLVRQDGQLVRIYPQWAFVVSAAVVVVVPIVVLALIVRLFRAAMHAWRFRRWR